MGRQRSKRARRTQKVAKRPKTVMNTPCEVTGKVRFLSKEFAVSEMNYKNVLYPKNPHKPIRAYKCPDCHYWHLTSMKSYEDA